MPDAGRLARMTSESAQVDVVVVGLGPGGESVATQLAQAGLAVVGVDRRLVGGECPYYGCVPSKMMIRAADVAGRGPAGRGPRGREHGDARTGRRCTPGSATRRPTTGTTRSPSTGSRTRGVTFVRGRGRLTGPRTVEVGGTTYAASRGVVLNTGTDPSAPPIDGLADTPYWTNRDAVQLRRAARLADRDRRRRDRRRAGAGVRPVRGAGHRARGGRPAPRARGAGGQQRCSREVFARRGHPGAGRRDDLLGGATPRAGSPSRSTAQPLHADKLLVAAGRRPNARRPRAGHRRPRPGGPLGRHRRADAGHRHEGLWAIGDITGKGAFTHMSMYQAAVAVRDILGQDGPRAAYHAVPHVTFTDPEVGSVGMTEQQARDAGLTVRVGTTDLASSTRGWIAKGRGPDQARRGRRPRRARRRHLRRARAGERCCRCWSPRCTPRCRPTRCGR